MSLDPLAPASNTSSSNSMAFNAREHRGIRTRVLLIAATAIIIACATFASMITIRHQLQEVVITNLSADLVHSIATFEDGQAQR